MHVSNIIWMVFKGYDNIFSKTIENHMLKSTAEKKWTVRRTALKFYR